MKGHLQIVFVACAFVAAMTAAQAQSDEPRLTGTFSSLNTDEEDLSGMEILVLPTGVVLVQVAAGELNTVVLVPINETDTGLSFDVPKPNIGAGHYEGRITDAGFEGTYKPSNPAEEEQPITLPRKQSYWD